MTQNTRRPRWASPGRIASFFQSAQITPLLALWRCCWASFAVLVTPREEAADQRHHGQCAGPVPRRQRARRGKMVAIPASRCCRRSSRLGACDVGLAPGLAVITVQFKVGVPRTEALVRLWDTVNANADWLPSLGVGEPLIKPRASTTCPSWPHAATARPEPALRPPNAWRHSLEADSSACPARATVTPIGGPGRAVQVEMTRAHGRPGVARTAPALHRTWALPLGDLLPATRRAMALEAGPFLRHARGGELVVGVHAGKPCSCDVAIGCATAPPAAHVWTCRRGRPGRRHRRTSNRPSPRHHQEIRARTPSTSPTPCNRVGEVCATPSSRRRAGGHHRNYGATANDKARQLIQKLLFATLRWWRWCSSPWAAQRR